ncbi:hypothetical protein [Catellatospora tritici]|uniref:hypothetical protein n=1 Tax=Catellatospora tritici TaxID=2851566 RepID=UPI001C2D8E6A|nr:hypothetical protein [Catellatospora tritici]MBV1852851.1 hypothetical protein [Catellatospora tritici]
MRIRIGAVAVLAAAGLAACSSPQTGDGVATAGGTASPAASAGAATDEREAIFRYARCMRDNGVTTFKDPEVGANGEFRMDLNGEGLDPKVIDAAQSKCKPLLPNGGEPQKMPADRLEMLRRYSQCMRDNGLATFPDPSDEGLAVNGNDFPPDDPKVKAAEEKCRTLLPVPPGGEGPSLSTQGPR